MSSLLSIGATVLKVSANKILEYYSSDKKSDVNKLGEAAPIEIKPTEDQLTPEELLKRQQVDFC